MTFVLSTFFDCFFGSFSETGIVYCTRSGMKGAKVLRESGKAAVQSGAVFGLCFI